MPWRPSQSQAQLFDPKQLAQARTAFRKDSPQALGGALMPQISKDTSMPRIYRASLQCSFFPKQRFLGPRYLASFLRLSSDATKAQNSIAVAMFSWSLGCFDLQPRRKKRSRGLAPNTMSMSDEVSKVSSTSTTESLSTRRAQEKQFVQRHDSENSEIWYLVCTAWLDKWKAFVTGKAGPPGPITNETLVRPDGTPFPGKRAVEHFRGVNAEVWKYLQSRHGGGPEIIRTKQIKLYVENAAPNPNVWSSGPQISSALAIVKSSFTGSPAIAPMCTPVKSQPMAPAVAPSQGKVTCDKCDGPHATENCPHFKKPREKHPDAWCLKGKAKLVGAAESEAKFVSRARVVRQPGDGSCMFHSVSYGLGDGSTAGSLRKSVADTIAAYPNMQILETPIAEWIRMDANVGVSSYVQSLRGGAWGGGIELAVLAQMILGILLVCA